MLALAKGANHESTNNALVDDGHIIGGLCEYTKIG